MTLIKTSILNAIAVVIKLLAMLGINKMLAIYVGPAGYAAIGQFQNAVQMITSFASGAINTGVTKYTAEYYEDEDKQRTVWRTAGTIAISVSLFSGVLITIFSTSLAGWILNDEALGSIFIWLAVTLVLLVMNALLLAILNGKMEIKKYILANIAGSLFALVVTSLMVILYGLYGALVALAIYQSLSFFISFAMVCRSPWFRLDYLFGAIDKKTAVNLAKYAAMALTSAACVPVSHILIRNHLGETLGWEAAGYWEAMWRLSAAYLMFITTTLSVYYLPRLSELKSFEEIKREIQQGYKIILPVAAVCGLMIYLLRDFIIKVLFTAEFAPMAELFAWQMVGDTLKIGGWLLAFVMLGKALVKLFIITEIIFAFGFYFLVVLLVGTFGLKGVALAHTINYLAYWVVMAIAITHSLKNMITAADTVSKNEKN